MKRLVHKIPKKTVRMHQDDKLGALESRSPISELIWASTVLENETIYRLPSVALRGCETKEPHLRHCHSVGVILSSLFSHPCALSKWG